MTLNHRSWRAGLSESHEEGWLGIKLEHEFLSEVLTSEPEDEPEPEPEDEDENENEDENEDGDEDENEDDDEDEEVPQEYNEAEPVPEENSEALEPTGESGNPSLGHHSGGTCGHSCATGTHPNPLCVQ